MRLPAAFLLFALIGLAVASSHNKHGHGNHRSEDEGQRPDQQLSSYPRPSDYAPQYRQQKEYLYQYDTQISTGLNGQSQNAVQRMRAQLRLTFNGEKNAVAQLKRWEAARLNEETNQPVSKMMNFESLRSVEIPKRHLDLLEKPFEISYDKGKVVEIVFDKQDQTWSENMKRAALNAFQLRMDVDERDSMTYGRNETTIEGECESIYTVIPEIKCNTVKSTEGRYLNAKDKGECVQVTKSVNFDKCTERPDLRYNHYRGEQMDTTQSIEQKEQRALEQSTISQAELKKDDGKYVLRFSRSISHQTVHLTEKSAMMAVSIGELQLKAIKKPTPNAQEVEQRKPSQSLMYSLEFDEMRERFMQEGNEEFVKQQPYLAEQNIADVLVNIGKRLAQSYVADSQDEWRLDSDSVAHQFTNLVKILRHATAKELENLDERLFKKDAEIPSEQQKSSLKRMYMDALALAATQPTTRQLLAKINGKELSEQEAATALQKMAKNAPMVGEEMLRSVWDLCQNSQQGSDLQHACVLAWSRMANTMCSRNMGAEKDKKIGDEWVMDKKQNKNKDAQKERCNSAMKQELAKNVQSLYDQAGEDAQQRILALKAYGNLGLDVTIQQVEQLITDRKLPRLQRIMAIDALRQLVTITPHKIRRSLMSIFVDKREHPEVRMNALHVILKSQPDKATIDQIGTEGLRESNANVRSFIISELRNSAKSMQKINAKCANQMRATVQLFKLSSAEQMEQMRRSGSRFASTQIVDQLINVAAIFSNDSALPKELMVQLDAAFRDHFIPALFQFGVHQQNVEQMIGKLFERIGSRSIDEILVRGKRSTLQNLYADPVQTMKQIFKKLNIVARRSNNDESQLMFYRRDKQFDTWFVLMDEKHMPNMLKQFFADGQLDMSAMETQGTRQLKSIDAGFIFETKVKVPTIFGVPVINTARLTKVSAMHGSISTELESTGKFISGGRVTLKTVPKLSMKMVQKLEAFSPLFTAGVQLQHTVDGQLPLTVEASYSEQEGLVIDMRLPEKNDRVYKLLQASSHPSTLYRQWPQKSRVYIEHEEHTMYLPSLQSSYTTMDKQLNCPMSQMRLEVRGHYHRDSMVQGLYLGENALEVHAHVTEKTAKIVRLQVRFNSKQNTGQSLEIQRLMRVFEQKRHQLFQDNVEPKEIKMLEGYLRPLEVHASSLYELDTKLMALNSVEDKKPKTQVEALIETSCDRDYEMCSVDVKAEMKKDQVAEKWTAHMTGNMAQLNLSGLHGSIPSQYVLAHVEAQFGDQKDKNSLTLCAYGRPSEMAVVHWNELKNIQSAARISQSKRYGSMEDDEYDRMVMKHLPSRLSANKYTFITEHQFTPETMKIVRPYLQYAEMAGKRPYQVLFQQESGQAEGQQEDYANRMHSTLKADLLVEGGTMRFRLNDITRFQRLPSWTSGLDMLANDEESRREQYQHLFMSENYESDEQKDKEDKKDELPSRQSYGQRQAMRKFVAASEQQNAKCVMDSSFNIESFDGKKYKIPMTTCYTVLAKDCSSASSPKFAVLAKKQSEQNSRLNIKLLIPNKQFVLFEDQNKKDMVIEMNGVKLREDEFEENGIHKITETRRPTYILHCSVTGMELRFDGRIIMVSISSDYINKQCGVCGHYNLDSEDTLRKEDNTLASSLKEFHASYLYRGDDEECSPKAQKEFDEMKEEEYHGRSKFSSTSSESFSGVGQKSNNQRMQQDKVNSMENREEQNKFEGKKHRKSGQKKSGKKEGRSDNYQDYETESERDYQKIEPIPKTMVVEEMDIMCFSIEPVKGCPKGSSPIVENWFEDDQDPQVDKQFVCKSRSSETARKLKKQLRKTPVLDEVKTMSSNKMMPVREVKSCARNPAPRSSDF